MSNETQGQTGSVTPPQAVEPVKVEEKVPTHPRTLEAALSVIAGHSMGALAADMIRPPLMALLDATLDQEARVIRINETKSQADPDDPKNTEILDVKWAHAIADGSAPDEIKEIEERHQEANRIYEETLKALREYGKSLIKPPLSKEEYESERAVANEAVKALNEQRNSVVSYAEMADKILAMVGPESVIPDGILSLIPEPATLKRGGGGRKSGGSTSGNKAPYGQRVGAVDINGARIAGSDGKSNLVTAADALSKMWNGDKFAPNKVTRDELQEALWSAANVGDKEGMNKLLSDKGEFEFPYQRSIKVQNPNDEGTHDELQIVNVKVYKWVNPNAETAPETAPTNDAPADAPADTPTDSAPANESVEGNTTPVESAPVETIDPVTNAPVNVGPRTTDLVAKRKAAAAAAAAKKATENK